MKKTHGTCHIPANRLVPAERRERPVRMRCSEPGRWTMPAPSHGVNVAGRFPPLPSAYGHPRGAGMAVACRVSGVPFQQRQRRKMASVPASVSLGDQPAPPSRTAATWRGAAAAYVSPLKDRRSRTRHSTGDAPTPIPMPWPSTVHRRTWRLQQHRAGEAAIRPWRVSMAAGLEVPKSYPALIPGFSAVGGRRPPHHPA